MSDKDYSRNIALGVNFFEMLISELLSRSTYACLRDRARARLFGLFTDAVANSRNRCDSVSLNEVSRAHTISQHGSSLSRNFHEGFALNQNN